MQAQRTSLPTILSKMQRAGPERFEKTGHWAWYVWPTRKEGFSDPRCTAVVDLDDVRFVLASTETREAWEPILEGLVDALRVQKTKRFLPSIDHGRIDFFCKEWSAEEYQEVMAGYPRFRDACDAFCREWVTLSAPAGAVGSRTGVRNNVPAVLATRSAPPGPSVSAVSAPTLTHARKRDGPLDKLLPRTGARNNVPAVVASRSAPPVSSVSAAGTPTRTQEASL